MMQQRGEHDYYRDSPAVMPVYGTPHTGSSIELIPPRRSSFSNYHPDSPSPVPSSNQLLPAGGPGDDFGEHPTHPGMYQYHAPPGSYGSSYAPEKPPANYGSSYVPGLRSNRRRRRWIVLSVILILIAIAAAVVIPIYFKVIKKDSDNDGSSNSGSSSSSSSSSSSGVSSGPMSGEDGSMVTLASGDTFKYVNQWGGSWYTDPSKPFDLGTARAQSFSPPLSQPWTYGVDHIRGVNIGGWFVLEPFISPALFQKYPSAVDEWTLSAAMRADTGPGGGISQIEDHYKTFITEQDFAEIAGAGLNWIRLPIPYWALPNSVQDGEPFLEGVAWQYILQAFQWARKYGLRVNLDLHTIPGSQNGYNHSGKGGQINWLKGAMGLANGQRSLELIRRITEFISQDEWKDVVVMFGILNEPRVGVIGKDTVTDFYVQAHNMIRSITGVGPGKGPMISVFEGFIGISKWVGSLVDADRVALDWHPYFAFSGQTNDEPVEQWPLKACDAWSNQFNNSQVNYGLTLAGEFSLGNNDCGLFLLGASEPRVGGTKYEAGSGLSCQNWTVWEEWDQNTKNGLMDFAKASMDSLNGGWFFWTWKIGNDSVDNSPRSPLWSYKLGLENGWIPTDPQNTGGFCVNLAGFPPTQAAPFDGDYSQHNYITGGPAAQSSISGDWPPSSISNAIDAPIAQFPIYTSTGSIQTLPGPTLTYTSKKAVVTVDAGSGWTNQNDNALEAVPIQGCTYPNAWGATDLTPTPCPGQGGARKRNAVPVPTAKPEWVWR